MKKNYLTRAERTQFTLTAKLKDILIGLLLGDLHIEKRSKSSLNVRLSFVQGLVHKDYLFHLYELFKMYSMMEPQTYKMPAHKVSGKEYSGVRFQTITLPCFTEFYNLFYLNGKKVLPLNMVELLTPLGLSYWIADDGCWNKTGKYVILATNGFTLEEVDLLVSVLNDKWDLKSYKCKQNSGYVIRIPSYSVPLLQKLLASHMPSVMKHKIGL